MMLQYEMQPLSSPFNIRELLIRLQARGHFGTEAQKRDDEGTIVFIVMIIGLVILIIDFVNIFIVFFCFLITVGTLKKELSSKMDLRWQFAICNTLYKTNKQTVPLNGTVWRSLEICVSRSLARGWHVALATLTAISQQTF